MFFLPNLHRKTDAFLNAGLYRSNKINLIKTFMDNPIIVLINTSKNKAINIKFPTFRKLS